MDTVICAQEVSAPVQDLGGRFMLDSATFAASAEVGLDPMGFYLAGRFGPLGARSAEEIADIATFIEPVSLKDIWDKAVVDTDIEKAGERYLQCCADWGRANLLGVAELEKFSSLAEKVIRSVDAASHAQLYGALKEMQWPEDLEGKTMVVAHILRELRFAHYTKLLKESGVTPLDAILLDNGKGGAKMFMWPEPFEEVEDAATARMNEVKEKTTELSAQDFSSLDESERQELVDSVKQIQAALK